MDFSNLPSASIDYSPYVPTESITLVLLEDELAKSTLNQFARFWKVWYTERGFYAPKLKDFIIVLRPGWRNNAPSTEGIQKFMDFFYGSVMFHHVREPVTIYQDNWASQGDDARIEFADEPSKIYSYAGLAGPR